MPLPQMINMIAKWAGPVGLVTTTTTTVDFVPTTTTSTETINAVVQVADMERLNPDMIDWSLRYLMVHSPSVLEIGQYILYNSIHYKIIQINNYGDYGYYEVVAEETKGDLV